MNCAPECTPKKTAGAHVCAGSLLSVVLQRLARSGRPDSNRRRPAWEAGILPTELRPQCRLAPSTQNIRAREERRYCRHDRFTRRGNRRPRTPSRVPHPYSCPEPCSTLLASSTIVATHEKKQRRVMGCRESATKPVPDASLGRPPRVGREQSVHESDAVGNEHAEREAQHP